MFKKHDDLKRRTRERNENEKDIITDAAVVFIDGSTIVDDGVARNKNV